MSDTAEKLDDRLKSALLAKDPIEKLTDVLMDGLDTIKIMAGTEIPDGAVRLNYAKYIAEICQFAAPSGDAESGIAFRLERMAVPREPEDDGNA
jgi:hypothetical protein